MLGHVPLASRTRRQQSWEQTARCQSTATGNVRTLAHAHQRVAANEIRLASEGTSLVHIQKSGVLDPKAGMDDFHLFKCTLEAEARSNVRSRSN